MILDAHEEIGGFGQELWEWLDYDPDYEVVPVLAPTREQKVWLSFLFVGFDSIATSSVVLAKFPELPRTAKELVAFNKWFSANASKLYVGKERKRLKYAFPKMLEDYIAKLGNSSQVDWLKSLVRSDEPRRDYDRIDEAVGKVKYMGTLTKYDFLELLQRQCAFAIAPTHMGTIGSGCIGPVKATKMVMTMLGLTPIEDDNKRLEKFALAFTNQLQRVRPYMDYALCESTLCKYQKLVGGRYYTGAEIDEQLGEITYLKKHGFDLRPLLSARQEVFSPRVLTENVVTDEEVLLSLKRYGGEAYAPVTEFNLRYRGITSNKRPI